MMTTALAIEGARPDNALADGGYRLDITFNDKLGNAAAPFVSNFIIDTTPPNAPSLNPVTTPTGQPTQPGQPSQSCKAQGKLSPLRVAGAAGGGAVPAAHP